MAVIQVDAHTYFGLSSDSKPTSGVQADSKFWETDTNDIYLYSGTAWAQIIPDAADAGPTWTSSFGVSGATAASANATSTPLVITDAPTNGKKIVLDDLEISVDTAMLVTLRTTTGNVVMGKYYLPANGTIQITTRGKKKAPTANQTLECLTSASGNIAVTATYHSE